MGRFHTSTGQRVKLGIKERLALLQAAKLAQDQGDDNIWLARAVAALEQSIHIFNRYMESKPKE